MGKDTFNAEEAAAIRAANLEEAKKTFAASGILGIVDGIRDLLPDDVEVKISEGNEISGTPSITFSKSENGFRDREPWEDPTQHEEKVPMVSTASLTIRVRDTNKSFLDFNNGNSWKDYRGTSSQLLYQTSVRGGTDNEGLAKIHLLNGLKRGGIASSPALDEALGNIVRIVPQNR